MRFALGLALLTTVGVSASATDGPAIESQVSLAWVRLNSCLTQRNERWEAAQEFTACMRIAVDQGFEILSVGDPVFADIRTDAGEHLVAQRMDLNERRGQGQGTLCLQLRMEYPARPARTIERMTGSIDLTVTSGRCDSARLRPLSAYVGKRIHIGDGPSIDMTMAQNGKELDLSMNADVDLRFRGISVAAHDRPLQQIPGGGRAAMDRIVHRTFPMPTDQDTVYLEFFSDVRVIRAPIELTDIPLAAPHPLTGDVAQVPLTPGSAADCVLAAVVEGPIDEIAK